jgi:hypothetical protein
MGTRSRPPSASPPSASPRQSVRAFRRQPTSEDPRVVDRRSGVRRGRIVGSMSNPLGPLYSIEFVVCVLCAVAWYKAADVEDVSPWL